MRLILFFFIFNLAINSSSFSKSLGDTNIVLSLLKLPNNISKPLDLEIKPILLNLSVTKLNVPKTLNYGIEADESIDVYFLIEKKINNYFKAIYPSVNYQYPPLTNRQFITLDKQDSVIYSGFNLLQFYNFNNGVYRIKTIFRFIPYSTSVSTKWYYFKVIYQLSIKDLFEYQATIGNK